MSIIIWTKENTKITVSESDAEYLRLCNSPNVSTKEQNDIMEKMDKEHALKMLYGKNKK